SGTACCSTSRGKRRGSRPTRSSRRFSPRPPRRRSSLGVLDVLKRVSGPISRRPPPPSEEELFDDDFQRKLEYLAIVSRRVFAGRLRAERRTKKSGSGVEFADHRDYVAGDDFRYLDWNVYQRFGRLLVRLYEEEEDLSI